ncbi:phosphatidylinositol-glycan biosynthesis class S protein [Xylariaceae sp. FL0255]|nr:phosphatidylinositol-glycan biosynthesis class S protein [Xylariaceae sp. FL0255]
MDSSGLRSRRDGPLTTAELKPEPIATKAEDKPKKLKQPPPENESHILRRSWIVASFWFVVVCLGIPVWWSTTAIYRADLPLDRMMDWADGRACDPVFSIPIAVEAPTLADRETRDLISATQNVLNTMTDFPGHRLHLEPVTATKDATSLTLRLVPGDATVSTLHPHLPILDVTYISSLGTSGSSGLAGYLAQQLRGTFAEEQALMSYFLSHSSTPIDQSLAKRMTRSMKYSGTYHLTFSLFTSGATPSSWDIDAAIDQFMRPVLDMLSPIHNFTIDTQIQLYATPGVQSQVLTKEDLSSFINAAEWPLSPSIGGAPTVNFVVFMGNQTIGLDPSDSGPDAMSQSWLVPQWGSIYLLQPPASPHVPSDALKQPVLTFASHLLSLLGTPQSGSLPLRLSTLTRVRSVDMLLRASSSLGSLARLSRALPSISIPSSVADGVEKSMHHLEQACAALSSGTGSTATQSLEHARIAETEAERAFFEKSMVGQLYFPDEHKIAVYMPLLGPVAVPLVTSLIAEIKAWRLRRRLGRAKPA